jgi:hypothetical protein
MQDLPRLLYRDNFLRLGRPQTRKNVITRNASMAHLRIEKINTAPPWGGVILVIYSVKSGEKRQKILLKSTLLAVFDRTLYASYCTRARFGHCWRSHAGFSEQRLLAPLTECRVGDILWHLVEASLKRASQSPP